MKLKKKKTIEAPVVEVVEAVEPVKKVGFGLLIEGKEVFSVKHVNVNGKDMHRVTDIVGTSYYVEDLDSLKKV